MQKAIDRKISNQSRVYLYVYDENHLIDFEIQPEVTSIFNVHENDQSVIPCRPTHPDVEITFYRNKEDITNKLDSYKYHFDPKHGLVISSGHKLHHRDNSMIFCK